MIREIYFAGGCFWGMEHLFSKVNGTTEVSCGYANGISDKYANYHDVCTGKSQFRETVKISYDDSIINLESLLFIFFLAINPTEFHRQGPDIGSQYQSGVYFVDEYSKKVATEIFNIEKPFYPRFYVELEPLKNFYLAEEYHQKYLEKNPMGYCHIPISLMNSAYNITISKSDYNKSAKEIFKNMKL